MTHKDTPSVTMSAQCACGAVTVNVDGRPRWMFLCACEDCQRMSGAGHSAVALFRRADVAVTGVVRSFDRPADSGATFTGHFCPACGTPVFGTTSRADNAILLLAGFFGAQAADWFAPKDLIFARSHRGWDEVPAGLPRHDTYPAGAF